ncbi:putative uncharacterized protein [Clostridium sp. CAG:678]|nr:putative uncharacterized protein [Clostridium sp. CAG:678]
MNEIKCPHCGKVFQVDESGYAAILKQVRDEEFTKELNERELAIKIEKESALKLANAESEKILQKTTAEKNEAIANLQSEIKSLKEKIALEVDKAVIKKDKEISEKSQQKLSESESKIQKLESELESSKKELKLKLANAISEKNEEIAQLKTQLINKETEKQLAVTQAISEKEKELSEKSQKILTLNSKLESAENEYKIQENALKKQYEEQLKGKDELIDYYKDFKARQSTKMVGESLEQHCEIEFNKLRATGFKNAYFEKDNDAKSGSKGDYIYRESDENGVEIISIMFEMKNEMDTTTTKHKNADFFKELDKDRNEKNCEYAILVSLLETDNELYNSGIVDVSYKYNKMYVIRPQFFIPMITLLRNAALNSLKYKQELLQVRNQNIDITNFEQNLLDFKDSFSKNYQHAHDRFIDAIKEIDNSIDHLQKIKENLTKSDNHLRSANNKIEGVSIKKLTKGNPTMQAKFAELNKS